MFDSKKWLILFFVLALLGSIGGSLVAYLILDKKHKADVANAHPAIAHPVEPVAPVEPATPPAAPVIVEPVVAAVAPTIDESIKPDFDILSRTEWKANPPGSKVKAQIPSLISIHHTATTPTPTKSLAGKLKGLQQFSQHEGVIADKKKPAYPDLPYHFYIDVNGKVGEGAEINSVAESSSDYDASGQIQIALEGNFEVSEPTKEQMDVLFKMVSWLSKKYKIPADKISSHKAFMTTACPGKNLERRLDEIRQFASK